MAKKSCGAFCSFCGACGRDVSGMFNKALVPVNVAPPGQAAPEPGPTAAAAADAAAHAEAGAEPSRAAHDESK